MAFHSPFLSKHCPDHRAKECQDRYTFADTFNACVNERMLRREHALWVTDKFIGTWEAWDCLCACHSCLRTVQGLWFHSQQWLLTDCSQPWALLHGLSPAQTQPFPSEMLSFSHSYSFQCLPAPCCWCPAERSGQKPSMATHYMHGNSARRQDKRNRVLTAVWNTVTKLETFSLFQEPAHKGEATNMWMLSWMVLIYSWIS